MARYKQLLFYAAKLPAMAAEDHTPENKVEGCVSQVSVCVCGVMFAVRACMRVHGCVLTACAVNAWSHCATQTTHKQHTNNNTMQNEKVWVKPELRPDGKVYWAADSDSQLTKGLAALLVLGLSGCTPQEILSVQPSFIELLGLKQSLTPSRNNGFLNMLLKMQRLTLQLAAKGGA